MFADKPLDQVNHLADQAAQSAEQAIRSTQRVANDALDELASAVDDIQRQGANAVRNGSRQLRHKAQDISAGAVGYIKDEPVKAVLIAAATGAALMALLSLLSRPHGRH